MPPLLSRSEETALAERLRARVPRWAAQRSVPKRPGKERDTVGLFSMGVVGIVGWSVGSMFVSASLSVLFKTPHVPLYGDLALGLSAGNVAKVCTVAMRAGIEGWKEASMVHDKGRISVVQHAREAGRRATQAVRCGMRVVGAQTLAIALALATLPWSVPVSIADSIALKKRLAQYKAEDAQKNGTPFVMKVPSRMARINEAAWGRLAKWLDPSQKRIASGIEACWDDGSRHQQALMVVADEQTRWKQARRWLFVSEVHDALRIFNAAPFNPTWTLPLMHKDEAGNYVSRGEVTLPVLLDAIHADPAAFLLNPEAVQGGDFAMLARGAQDAIALHRELRPSSGVGSTRSSSQRKKAASENGRSGLMGEARAQREAAAQSVGPGRISGAESDDHANTINPSNFSPVGRLSEARIEVAETPSEREALSVPQPTASTPATNIARSKTRRL